MVPPQGLKELLSVSPIAHESACLFSSAEAEGSTVEWSSIKRRLDRESHVAVVFCSEKPQKWDWKGY